MESRGRKMLALLERNKNDTVGTSEEQCTSADSSSKGVTQTPKENSEEADVTRPSLNETGYGNSTQTHVSSSSSNSSTDSSDSSSSDSESFCEDSDDSVKDPMYIPPENPSQNNHDELPADEENEILSVFDSSIQNLPSTSSPNTTNTSARPSTSREAIPTIPTIPTSPAVSPEKKRRRKRKRDEAQWKKNIAKRLRNTGKAYQTTKKKIREERKIKEPCGEKCRLKCGSKFTEEERKTLFENFWALGDNKNNGNIFQGA